MRPISPVAALLAAACTPTETNVSALQPELVVAPDSLDFGEVVVDYQAEERIELINDGMATLEISSISFADGSAGVFGMDQDALEIERGERAVLYVTCLPTTYATYADTIYIESDDPERPLVQVELACTGVHAPTPDIELDPLCIDFGTVEIGVPTTQWATLSNTGDGDLTILSTEQLGSGQSAIGTDPQGSVIAPDGDEYIVIVTYTPVTSYGDNGTFTITSDDPDESELTLTLLGNDGGDFEYPVAVIEGPTETEPLEVIALDGSASYDPGDEELTYEWFLAARPEGSGGELTATDSPDASLYVDIAGDYQVTLSVTNESGIRSAPAKHDIAAIPTDDIHVEMFWDAGDSDVDLHLLQAGTELFALPSDCCYCNSNPDWGDDSSEYDDPTLDLDDTTGYGPENINIAAPEDGEYDIYVHYFMDNGASAVTSTVRVYLDGEAAFETSEVMEHNERWFVGSVLWPDAVVAENEGEQIVGDSGKRSCYDPEDEDE